MRQKNYFPTGHSDQYNAEGYRDMTAYLALRNIEREERAKRHAKRRQRTLPPAPEGEGLAAREDEKFAREELANAIIIQAAQDFRAAKHCLQEDPDNEEAKQTVAETEAFFLSNYYCTLTTYSGRTLLNRLRKEFGEDEL